jgi:hypothetical protein
LGYFVVECGPNNFKRGHKQVVFFFSKFQRSPLLNLHVISNFIDIVKERVKKPGGAPPAYP